MLIDGDKVYDCWIVFWWDLISKLGYWVKVGFYYILKSLVRIKSLIIYIFIKRIKNV